MLDYVLVFAPTVEKHINTQIPVILKDKPAYLKGVFNLPGGKLEKNESVLEASVRELYEETGLTTLACRDCQPELMGQIICHENVIYCVKIPVSIRQDLKPRAEETEKVNWYNIDYILEHKSLMPNLRIIIPFCQLGYKDWIIVDEGNFRSKNHSFAVNLGVGFSFTATVEGYSNV